MIESKLYQAAQSLPTPNTSFFEIENKVNLSKKNQAYRPRRYRMVAAILACVFLLMGSAMVAASTEVNLSAWANRSGTFEDASAIADELGIVLPETLDHSPFYNITTMHVVPEGTTYLEALNTPVYRWYSADYGIQNVVCEYNSDSPDSGFSESTVVYDEYTISFGGTDNELYQYVFSLDESGNRILDDALSGSYYTEAYNGITLQIFTDMQYDDDTGEVFAYHHRVLWIDTSNHAVFSLHKSFYAEENAADQLPAEMLEFAKTIIDINN